MIEPGALFEGSCKMIKANVGATAAPVKDKINGKEEKPLDTTSMAPVKADAVEEPAKSGAAARIAS
jgi:hypothetical protein